VEEIGSERRKMRREGVLKEPREGEMKEAAAPRNPRQGYFMKRKNPGKTSLMYTFI
jgi:hypothetical protein